MDMGMGTIGFDPLYFLMLAPVLLFSMWASASVKSRFAKYSQVRSRSGITGAEAASRILQAYGLSDVRVEQTSGWLSDHYSPADRVLRLSEAVYGSSSIASIGVAAHEAGHALQHAKGYAVMGLWQMLAKPAAIGSNLSYWLILAGVFLSSFRFLMIVGVILFAVVVLFQLVTLPLEFNASSRAKRLIVEMGILGRDEAAGVSSVLGAAAMTYVAAAASSIVTLIYYLVRFGILSNRD